MIISESAYLQHHGVKGQHWGFRKNRDVNNGPKNNHTKAKIAVGATALVAAGLLVNHLLKKEGDTSISSKGLAPFMAAGKGWKIEASDGRSFDHLVKSMTEQRHGETLTGVVHASRGKNAGFRFLKTGGLSSPLHEYEKTKLNDTSAMSYFQRYGAKNEKVAARFLDPHGRKDRAGRAIFHEVLVPPPMADGLHSHEDVKNHVWPLIKDGFESLYNQ